MATGKFFQEIELPQQKSQIHDRALFPAVLSPPGDATNSSVELCVLEDAIRAEKAWLECLLKERGAILFRGFPVTSPYDFNDVLKRSGSLKLSMWVAELLEPKLLAGFTLQMNALLIWEFLSIMKCLTSYVPDFPTKLFFFCEEEPGKGGETPIVLSHIIYERMKEKHPEFVAQLEEHGLTYIKFAGYEDDPSSFTGSSWKSAYKTDDKSVVEERAAKLGTKLEWMGNAAKVITGPVPAVRFNKESGRKTWFNSLAASYSGPASEKVSNRNTTVELANGDPAVPDDAMEDLMKILEEECVAIPWKKGDVLLVNNLMVIHSRRPLLKPPRRVLASLCK